MLVHCDVHKCRMRMAANVNFAENTGDVLRRLSFLCYIFAE